MIKVNQKSAATNEHEWTRLGYNHQVLQVNQTLSKSNRMSEPVWHNNPDVASEPEQDKIPNHQVNQVS